MLRHPLVGSEGLFTVDRDNLRRALPGRGRATLRHLDPSRGLADPRSLIDATGRVLGPCRMGLFTLTGDPSARDSEVTSKQHGEVTPMQATTREEIASATRAAVEAAVWAPSVHNTQPWCFDVSGSTITVKADPDRLLPVGDFEGRELLISCGAALFNVQITLRALGYELTTRVLPDPDRPSLLAIVRIGGPAKVTERVKLLHGEVTRRRTHRGRFSDLPVARHLLEDLCQEAEKEGAILTPVQAEAAVRVIAAVTRAAEEIQEQDQAFSLELLRWSRRPGSSRPEGVPPEAYPRLGNRHARSEFAQRDYAHGNPWGYDIPHGLESHSDGVLAMLTTAGDSRQDWLAAGQGLQRILLLASAYDVSAAFHTQALEFAHLRAFLREELCSGQAPQMIMRLGSALHEGGAVRRPLTEVLDERPT